MPITMSHSGFCTRDSSLAGSRNSLKGTARASSISFGVRWLMKIGLPRHFTVTICPSAILAISTSVEEAASVVASGLIWSISGHATKPAAATPIAPVATNRKSLRVGSSAIVLAAILTSNSGIFP